MEPPTSSFWQEVRSKSTLLLGTLIVSLLTVFSDYIVDKVKTGVNRANTRTTYFDIISKELSAFLFNAELAEEITAQRITDRKHIEAIMADYNSAVTTLRKNEYYHYALLDKYWSDEALHQYRTAMQQAKRYDAELHQLNPVYEQILAQRKDSAVRYLPVMQAHITRQGPALHQALDQLQRDAETFLLNF